LYTVTGWDGAAIPLDAVLPVFGGYPDAPWDESNKPLYGNEIYAFRFNNRVAGSMGAVGGRGQNAASSYRGTPFLTAEVGDGGEDTYFRRPVYSTNDVAAIAPVMLGSGVNLLGYYMFHGGVNPDSEVDAPRITLEESQRTGGATDVPEKSYDFQAPLGAFGQERESLRRLKLVHYFLNDFGALLAPMTTRAPNVVPSGPADTRVVRVAARTDGERGFVFVNNYVRGLQMPERKGFQVRLKLPDSEVHVPESPIDLPAGAYGIWPVNLRLSSRQAAGTPLTLRYSTAQLFKRVEMGDQLYYFFFALPGVRPEFALDSGAKVDSASGGVEMLRAAWGVRLLASGAAEIRLADGVHLVVLPEAQAEEIWRGDDPAMLLETKAEAFSDGTRWTLRSDNPEIGFGLFGGAKPREDGLQHLAENVKAGLFTEYSATLKLLSLKATVTKIQDAKPRLPWAPGPEIPWRAEQLPMKPATEEFPGAATWRIQLPPVPDAAHVSDVWLKIDYQGDVARLSDGGRLVDDNFWNGLPWSIGLREVLPTWRSTNSELQLRVLPLPEKYPMYLEKADELHFAAGVADQLTGVQLIPQYEVVVDLAEHQ
jgi:beta-galactosidase